MPLPYSLPAPRTWAPFQQIKAPYLRADVSDACALFAAPPMFSGSQANTQAVASGTDTPLAIDTEAYDNAFGHLDTVNPPNYYGQFAGYYLAQGTWAANYTGGSGAVTAAIGNTPSGGSQTLWYGQRMGASGTGGQFAQPVVAKIIPLVTLAPPVAGTGDSVCLIANQNSGASRNTLVTGGQLPVLTLRWIGAPSGVVGLSVPALPAWPVPPAFITSTFLNAAIRDTINWLILPPIMEAFYQAGTQSLASQASQATIGTAVNLDHVTVDNYSAFNTSTHTWTVPANAGGIYWCYGQAHQSMNGTSVALGTGLTVTSANYNGGATATLWGGAQQAFAGSGAGNCAVVRRRLRLNPGDTVQLAAFQNDSGGNPVTLDFVGGAAVSESRLITVWENV